MMSKIFFLYGEETFLLKQFLDELHSSLDAEFITADGTELTEAQLLQKCTSLPFFNSKQIIHFTGILENKQLNPESELLQQLLLSPPDHLTLIFSHEGDPDKRKKLYKLLCKTSDVKEFKPLLGRTLQIWIEEQFQQQNGIISHSALTLLESFTGNNLWQLAKEIEKLSLYAMGKTITEDDIKNITTASSEVSVFTFVDLLGEKKTKPALELLHSLVKDRYETIPLLAMIVRQVRLLLQCLSLQQQYGNRWKQHLSLHPFVLQKIERQAKNFTITELQHLYQKLYNIDKQMKSVSLDPVGLLDRLTIELTQNKSVIR